MGDRLSFYLDGSMEDYEGTDESIGALGIAGAVVRLVMVLTGAATGDDFTCNLTCDTGGGGDNITFTIADGATTGTVITDQLDVGATETLYLRVTEAAAGTGLRGWFEFEPTGASAVTALLTTLAIVKTDAGISVATYDAQLTRLISGVSSAMQKWIGHRIVDTSHTDEYHSGNGWQSELILNHRPITTTDTMVVEQDDVEVSSALYTQDLEAGIVYLDDGYWTNGNRNYKVTYSSGYTSIPDDLVMAATAQVIFEYRQSNPGGNRLGIGANADASGGSTPYYEYNWLPMVKAIMAEYRRKV